MKPPSRWLPLLLIVLSAVLFDGLFFDMATGANVPVFVALIVAILLYRQGWRGMSAPARATMLGALVCAAMVAVHHSAIAVFASVCTLAAFAAFVHEPLLRSIPYTVPQFIMNGIMLPVSAWEGLGELMNDRRATRKSWRWGKLILLPLIVTVVFFQMYRVGNPKFDQFTAGFLDGLSAWLAEVFGNIFTPHLFFFLFALVLCAVLLLRHAPGTVLRLEQQWTDLLQRTRIRRPHWMAPRGMNPLERERRMGVVLLVLVNLLLLVVNVIDIDWVWFGFEVPVDFSLKQFVHEGTWMLIISILLSMLILLHLFRGNQNFFARSGSLKALALVWVVQNFILGVSVFLRNYHYISFHGLAYKRIGVIVFLVLVLVGLITLFVKILERKSFFYLLRVNGWAAFAVLVGLSTVNWDGFIVRTNLRHDNPGEIDIDNYLAMSDKVLPLLYDNLALVSEQMARHRTNRVRWVDNLDPADFKAQLDAKRDRFLGRYASQQWQEWNLADRRTALALTNEREP